VIGRCVGQLKLQSGSAVAISAIRRAGTAKPPLN